MEFERKLWLYWDKGAEKMPPLIRRIYEHNCFICAKFGWEVILLTLENIGIYFKNISPRFYTMIPYHQADYIRVYALRDYSGVWLDTDFIVTDNLDLLFDKMDTKQTFLGIREHIGGCIGTAVLAAKKNDPISIFNCEEAERRIIEVKDFEWGTIGPQLLQVTPENLSPYFKIIDDKTAINSVNFATWLRNPGHVISWWYKENSSQARDVADIIESYSFPIVGTWTIYRNHSSEISERLVEMIFDDDKSVFHHLMSTSNKTENKDLKVLYGGGENVYTNVTEIFRQTFIHSDLILLPKIKNFNTIFGDPIHGAVKSLIIMFNKKIFIINEDDLDIILIELNL
jgi:hypothetical protein